MHILLDTNVLLWAAGASGRFDRATTDLLQDPSNTVMFSAASIWEIAIKTGLGRPDFQIAPDSIVKTALEAGFIELPVRSETALRVAALPHHHRDPFDRLLVAQAMAEPAVLLTTDRILTRYTDLVTLVGRQPS